jgi:3-phosphoshikimate 1-carboxyvinyltransferase
MADAISSYPDKLVIEPLSRPPQATIRVPGSKSITNRALVLAALQSCGWECVLTGALRSEDTEVMVHGLQQLGFKITADWPVIHVARHHKDIVPVNSADLFVANSGTTMRFLTAVCAIGKGRYRLNGLPRMRERPIEDLLLALRAVGAKAQSELGNGCPPVIVQGKRYWAGDHVQIKGDISSQFLSGLLMVAPIGCQVEEFTIEVIGSMVSEPYVQMTMAMMHAWGLPILQEGTRFKTQNLGACGYQGPDMDQYAIEPDASAASYFWAAAATSGGAVQVHDLNSKSIQGDVRFVDLLERMGCRVERETASITVRGATLRGIDVDMNDISDTVMTLAAVACFAEGPTTIRNVAHIRHKETDRLAALATELRRVGVEVVEFTDGLTITPRPLHGAEIETYNDHRMAMSMALIGLKVPGIVIKNPGCVAKTYPGFFADLEKLR